MRGAENIQRGEKARLRLHPLFLLTGVLSACFGALPLFLLAVIAALEHECAHAFAARRFGYALNQIVLMPYGAVVSGDLTGISRSQQLYVLAAGPLANAVTALGFTALWWLYPETYPYTDAAAYVSFSLFLVNLLPAYPLDGGRMLSLLLAPIAKGKTKAVLTAFTLLTAAGVFAYFVLSCFSRPAFTALAFSVMLAAGAFGGEPYSRLPLPGKGRFLHGVKESRVALDASLPLRTALRYLGEDRYLTLLLFEDGEFFAEVAEEELFSALERGDYALPLRSLAVQYEKM